jgi:thiamine biosynthesis lipoprotein ApbE
MLWIIGCEGPAAEKRVGERLMMGSFASVVVYTPDVSAGDAAINDALTKMENVDKLMSHYKPESEISQINRLAGGEPLKVSPDTFRVIQAAIDYGHQTGGAFDVTIAPLVKSWGFFKHEKRMPSVTEIQEQRKLVDYKQIQVNDVDITVMLKKADMQLELGGIAKGYTVDLAAKALRWRGITAALANLSNSTFFAIGRPPDKPAWKIAIQHPRKKDALLGTVSVKDEALATSADSEQFFIHNGVRYGHIIDPWTGYPVSNGIVSTTVVAPTGMEADALATAVFVLGPEKGMEMIQDRTGVEAIIVREAPTGELIIEVSLGLEDRFEPAQKEVENESKSTETETDTALTSLYRTDLPILCQYASDST